MSSRTRQHFCAAGAACALLWVMIIPAAPAAAQQEQILDGLRAAMREAARHGITSIQDMSASPEVLRVYQKLLAAGELTVRVSGHQPLPEWKRVAGIRVGFGSEKLKVGGLKGFSDGSPGSTTALFFEPYEDAPHTTGLAADEMIPESRILGNLLEADRAGLHSAVHAIGDKANSRVLDLFEEVSRRKRPSRPALPHRARAAPPR